MIPSGDEGARRAEEKGFFVFRLYVVDEGPQREPSRTSAPSAKNICPITTR